MATAAESVDVFGLEPEVESKEQLPIFLRAIARLQAASAALVAKYTEQAKKRAEELAEKQIITVEDEFVSRVDYAARLEAAVCDFARDHHDELFTDKRSTWKTDAGNITTKTQPEKVVFVDPNADEDGIIQAIIEQSELLPELSRLREEFADAFPYLRLRLELDKSAILKLHQDDTQDSKQTTADLTSKGIKIDRAPRKYSVKLA